MEKRPQTNEYSTLFANYINLVPDGNIIDILDQQSRETIDVLKHITEEQGLFRYDDGKWSIKEILGHIADTERIMSHRLLCIARGETQPLIGFNENQYVQAGSFDRQSIQDLLQNMSVVRLSTLYLLKNLDENEWLRQGTANQSIVSVRALAYIIVGHELHHLQILKDRYLKAETYLK